MYSLIISTDSDPLASVPLDGKDLFDTLEEAMEAAKKNILFLITSYEPGEVQVLYEPASGPPETWIKIEISPLLSKART